MFRRGAARCAQRRKSCRKEDFQQTLSAWKDTVNNMNQNDMNIPEAVFTEQSMPVLRWLGDQLPGGFFIYRADSSEEVLYVNRAALHILGCDSMEAFRAMTGNSFRGLVHPEDVDAVQRSIRAHLADESGQNMDFAEYRVLRQDGSVRWINGFGHFAQMPGYGGVYYVFITDITEKHRIEAENRQRAGVIEGLSVNYGSIFLLDLDDGTCVPYRISDEYFRKLTAEKEGPGQAAPDWSDVFSAYARRFVTQADRARYLSEIDREHIRERLKAEPAYSVNYMCIRDDGTPVYAEMFLSGIGTGERRRAVMAYQDVTERTMKVQQEVAQRLHTEMELERERHANEIKSSFLFNISHDIRTPMNAIMGFSDLAKRHLHEPERLIDYLGKVDESSRQLLALIDDMLEMSRIDYGRIEIKAEATNLREQLDMVLDLFRAQAEEKHLTLTEKIDLPEREVFADENRFRRIMGNLISNAVKFTPDGGKVTVSARQKQVSDSGYARFEFTFSDTGVGMTEEFMRRMYEAFEREESSTRTGAIGAGLGLSITKSLLDMMGGSISVRSSKNEGSAFTVDLPLKFADHAAESTDKAEMETAHKAEGEYRILLVEDIEINRMLAETILEEADFQVESVVDGCDAVEAIRMHPLYYYDLVLMDIQMPVMNGYEATRAIRALNRKDTEDLPIIALSANAREEDRRQSLESGMNNHIAKPFDVAHLINTVNEHIAARGQSTGKQSGREHNCS